MSTGLDLQSLREVRSKPFLCNSRAVFTSTELAYCASKRDPVQSICGLISTKEAFIKAVSAFDDVPAFRFTHVQIDHDPAGRPSLRFAGELAAWLESNALSASMSISHSGDIVGSIVVLAGRCRR